MENYCYYGRMAVDSESFRQLNGVHIYMTKELIEKMVNKAVAKVDKEIVGLLKPLTLEIKRLSKELKLLDTRVKKLEPEKVKKAKGAKTTE